MLIEQLIDIEKVRTDNLKFRTDLRDLAMDGWSKTQMNVYKDELLKKSSNQKSNSSCQHWSLHGFQNRAFHLQPIWLQISVAVDSDSESHAWHRFRAFARHHLKSLCCLIRISGSEQTPFSRTGRQFRPAALHRIRFGTCGFVPMSYFYSETNEWSQDWAKRWARLWSATTSRQFHRNFHFTWKKKVTRRGPKFTKH